MNPIASIIFITLLFLPKENCICTEYLYILLIMNIGRKNLVINISNAEFY